MSAPAPQPYAPTPTRGVTPGHDGPESTSFPARTAGPEPDDASTAASSVAKLGLEARGRPVAEAPVVRARAPHDGAPRGACPRASAASPRDIRVEHTSSTVTSDLRARTRRIGS